jgi:hypothetical protein
MVAALPSAEITRFAQRILVLGEVWKRNGFLGHFSVNPHVLDKSGKALTTYTQELINTTPSDIKKIAQDILNGHK